MRPTPSPTGSAGSRSLSPAIGKCIFCLLHGTDPVNKATHPQVKDLPVINLSQATVNNQCRQQRRY